MKIRSYKQQDLRAVVALWSECGLVAPQNDPVKDIARKLQLADELLLVGVMDGEIVATVMGGYEGHRGWINYLAVKPSRQGLGLGRQMMTAIEEKLLGLGCPKINLQVRSSNRDVIAFYQAIGFAEDPVVSMGKRLLQD